MGSGHFICQFLWHPEKVSLFFIHGEVMKFPWLPLALVRCCGPGSTPCTGAYRVSDSYLPLDARVDLIAMIILSSSPSFHSDWFFESSWLLHKPPTCSAVGTTVKCLCCFLAYQREEDIIIHHFHAVWGFDIRTGLDTPRAARPYSCSLWQCLWGQPEESRQISSRNDFNPVKKIKWQQNRSLEAWLRTSPQEFNWPEMMCTCFRLVS